MKRHLIFAISIVALVCGFTLPAQAREENALVPLASSMPEGKAGAPAPFGFVSFCIRFADQCQTDKSSPAVIPMTPALWSELQAVNNSVNQSITPVSDLEHYGVGEYWTIPTDGRGDCEDYALTKRAQLIAAGVSERALRIAVVRTASNQGHAVLTISTDHGDYVLDNLVSQVRGWVQTDYQWIERQDPNDTQAWVLLAPEQNSELASISAIGSRPIN